MESPVDSSAAAWQPFTPTGVAAFARSSWRRLLVVQSVVAVVAAGITVWVASTAWCPAISSAIEHLPEKGEVRAGRLAWSAPSPQTLAESRFLAVAVDLEHSAKVRSPAHIQVEFGEHDVRFYSLFGCLPVDYPKDKDAPFNLQELKPRWGAWLPSLLAIAGGVVLVGLMLSWWLLASLYCLPAWLLSLYLDRELTLLGCWRLSGAALLPGAWLMIVGIGFYGLGKLDVIQLMGTVVLHFLVGWTYLVLGVIAAPKTSSLPDLKTNPFQIATGPAQTAPMPSKQDDPNPFRPRGD